MSSAECRFRPAIGFIVPSRPTSGHRTLKLVGLIQREHATKTPGPCGPGVLRVGLLVPVPAGEQALNLIVIGVRDVIDEIDAAGQTRRIRIAPVMVNAGRLGADRPQIYRLRTPTLSESAVSNS